MGALTDFVTHFRISPGGSPRDLLERVGTAFACLPYENVSKIVRRAEAGTDAAARRSPEEVIRGYIDRGTGGTCFSLTSALAFLVRGLGYRADTILADRRYGPDTHCALMVWLDGIPHLMDPGFLIARPIPLECAKRREVAAPGQRLVLESGENPGRVALSTVRKGSETRRLTYKIAAADRGAFLKAWDASFGWDMMRVPLLTRRIGARQIYLNGTRFQASEGDSVARQEWPAEKLVEAIAAEFRIDASLVARAVAILKERGETLGKTSNR